MKKAKLLSLFLAGALLFQTAGIDAMATASFDPAPISETVEDVDKDLSEQPTDEENESTKGENNPENPSKDEETPDPDEGEKNPETPSENEENANPDREEGDPEKPAEGDAEEETPDAEDGDPEKPAEGNEETESPDKEDEEIKDSISENSVSENTVSENTLDGDETDIFSIFPGLGDNYTFSSKQLANKRVLADHVGDVVQISSIENATLTDFKDTSDKYESGEVVYLAKNREEAEQVAKAFGGTLDSYSYEVAVIDLPEKATVPLAIAAAADPKIKLPAVWPNYYQYLYEDTYATVNPFKPSDPGYSDQWMHDYIGSSYAWAAGYKGAGVNVAVIDTGLDRQHEDLKLNADTGKNFCDGAAGTDYNQDNDSHGTHVAGIIAADDNGTGVVGIAPDARVRGYCVFPKGAGAKTSDIIKAVNAAVLDKNDIINMSLGSTMYDQNYEDTINAAYEKGVAIFAAAGNEDIDAKCFPAAFAGTITVGAVDKNGTRASFSNYGKTVTLSFPGVSIYSTVPTGTGPENANYDYMDGTSMACPAAAGTAAVILSAKKDTKEFQGLTGKKRVDKLLSLMKSSTTKCSTSGMGAGTTYLPGVLKLATDMTAPETPVITVVGEADYKRGKNKRDYIEKSIKVKLSSATAVGVDIYYATDGKTPAYKNGVITNADSAEPYKLNTEIELTGAKSKTIKAIAVNPISGKVSKTASLTVTLTPIPNKVTVTPAGNVTKIAAGKSLKFTAAVEPSYAISKNVQWSVVKIENGTEVDVTKQMGIKVANGTVSTTSNKTTKTPAGKYKVKATAVGNKDLKFDGGESGSYEFEVIESSAVKKVAFQDDAGKAPKPKSIKVGDNKTTDTNEELNLATYLTVTKTGATTKDETTITGAAALAEVVWSSSNEKIAKVDSKGVVTAVAPGKATIKATSNDGLNKSASYNVTVVQPVTKITIDGPKKVAVGKGISLTAKVEPANATKKTLEWSISGDTKIVSIGRTNGKISTKKGASGEYTVTAKAADDLGASATYTIKIENQEITEISFEEGKKLTMFPPNTSAEKNTTEKTLKAIIKGKTAGSSEKPAVINTSLIAWSSSAPSIASVDQSGKITAKAPGKATITCAATDGSNKKATCAVTVKTPMSKLVIGPADANAGCVAVGKKVKMIAKYYSKHGTPTDKKIHWEITAYSNDTALKGKVSIDKNGTLSVNKNLTYSSGQFVTITATAVDGSGVASNTYNMYIVPNYIGAQIVYNSKANAFYMITKDAAGDQYYGPNYCTASISGSKNCGLDKDYAEITEGGPVYTVYQPIPTKRSSNPLLLGSTVSTSLLNREAEKMTLTIKLKDGSNLTAKKTIYAVIFEQDGKEYLFYYF